jgi:hypothetical protein
MTHAMPPGLKWIADFMAANPLPENTEEGKFYIVPCIEWHDKWIKRNFGNSGIAPLIGTVHEDRDIIGFKPWHIHVDTRFLRLKKDGYNLDPVKALGAPVCLTSGMFGQEEYWDTLIPMLLDAKVSMRRRRCVRSQPEGWPSDWRFIDPLEKAYATHCAVNGTCPHRGLPLSGGRDMGNGVRQCFAHGLCWRPDGRMVRRQELVEVVP